MYDPNIFAVLNPHDQKNKASSAFELHANAKWFRKATGGVAVEPTINSREPTPAADSPSESDNEAKEEESIVNRLVVTFDQLLALDHLENGLQLGTNPNISHVLLGHRGTKGISGKQCNITVDDSLRIWLHDYGSSHGTAVGQNGMNQIEIRTKETWILAFAPGTPSEFDETTIHCGGLGIRIEFPNHVSGSQPYVDNLRAFAKTCREAATRAKEDPPGVEALGLESEPATQAPSDAPTPRDRLIYYEVGTIGKGSFGQVSKAIRARDGMEFAVKMFYPPPSRNKRRRDQPDSEWLINIRREFTIMRDNPHPNVVQVFELREKPEPAIIMDYFPFGSMVNADIIEETSCITAWGQVLDGLSHLHARNMAHRDLKPENILVKQLEPVFKVAIADFGLAKEATGEFALQTFCGSPKYLAPEVWNIGLGYGYGSGSGYSPLVDVWSLGIIVLEMIYDNLKPPARPKPRKKNEAVTDEQWRNWFDQWNRQLNRKLHDEEEDIIIGILLHMINVEVSKRWTAARCLEYALDIGLFERRAVDGLVACPTVGLTGEEADATGDGIKTPRAAQSMRSVRTQSLVSKSGSNVSTVILLN